MKRKRVPTVAEVYDHMAATYDDRYETAECWAENQVIRGELTRIIQATCHSFGCWPRVPTSVPTSTGCHIVCPYQILDVGCGTGLLLDLLPSYYTRNYVGFDISAGMVERCRAKYPEHRSRIFQYDMDGPDWPGADGQCDLVVSLFGSMSHSEQPEALLGKVATMLRPGGRALLMFLTGRRIRNMPMALELPMVDLHSAWFRDRSTVVTGRLRVVTMWGLSYLRWPVLAGRHAYKLAESLTLGRVNPNGANYLVVELERMK